MTTDLNFDMEAYWEDRRKLEKTVKRLGLVLTDPDYSILLKPIKQQKHESNHKPKRRN